MSDTPTWYDLLDVSREASTDEIRAAWKVQIADLEPGDRRFDTLNRAAKMLLDPPAREAYDAGLAEPAQVPALAGDGAPTLTDVETDRERSRLVRQRSRDQARIRRTRDKEQRADRPARTAGDVPSWLLTGLGVLAAGLVAATAWMWTSGDEGDDSAAREAQVAAERAVVPVLSYDYETLEGDQRAAQALMTGGYREEYDKLFTVLEDNAPQTQTRVTADVIASGIVRAAADRVQVLVFVDRPTTNKLNAEPVVYKDQVTVAMQLVDGEWLVDDLTTSPVQG